jgi:flagellin
VTGTRADGTQESFLVTGAATITGTGQSFDEFAALAATTRLNNNLNPGAQVFRQTDSAAAAVAYNAGDVVYDDSNGRFYLTRGAAGDYGNASTSAANASSTTEFLSLGTSLPGLTDYEAYDSAKGYYLDDIVSYDGNLYVANKTITNGEGAPITNTTDWVRLNVSVTGNNNLLNEDNDIFDFSVGDLKEFIQTAAVSRATNGAQTQRVDVSLELLQTNHTNLLAANSRLADVDVATESTDFARNNILVQASASMLSQANASMNIALSLLQ